MFGKRKILFLNIFQYFKQKLNDRKLGVNGKITISVSTMVKVYC